MKSLRLRLRLRLRGEGLRSLSAQDFEVLESRYWAPGRPLDTKLYRNTPTLSVRQKRTGVAHLHAQTDYTYDDP
jgi:hypothetical protein